MSSDRSLPLCRYNVNYQGESDDIKPDHNPSTQTILLPSRKRRQQVANSDTLLFYDDRGALQPELSLIHQRLQREVTGATATIYCRDFQAFMRYLKHLDLDWLAPPAVIRQTVADYLRHQEVSLRAQGDHWQVHSHDSPGRGRDLRVVVESLRAVYRTARRLGLYAHPDDPLTKLRLPRQRSGPPQPPSRSGLTKPLMTRMDRSHYFLFQNGSWVPQHLLEPNLYERLLDAFKGGNLRDLIILRLLLETGARVSEICTLTVRGWSQTVTGNTPFGTTFRVANKGLGTTPRKLVSCSATTSALMQHYFANDRQEQDPLWKEFRAWRQSANMSPEAYHSFLTATGRDAPLFANQQGRPYTTNAWRKGAWRPRLAAAGLSLRPHQLRHWYVSTSLRAISDKYRNNPVAYNERRQALGRYMGWAAPERMLAVYDQSLSETRMIELVSDVTSHLQMLQRLIRSGRP